MKIKSLNVLAFVAGLTILCLAVFAQKIGVDHNESWGQGRIVLAVVGIIFIVLGVGFPIDKILSFLMSHYARKNITGVSFLLRNYIFLTPFIGLVFVVYVWFASVGSWTTWYPRTEYYSLLARGFQKHQLHLPVTPSEKLLALPNPYDPSLRQGVGEPMDFSLYQGKFYLYWGPVPALILIALDLFVSKPLPDLYLVFGFSCGLFLIQVSLIIYIWDCYFSQLPNWILAMAVLLIGLAGPYPWMIGLGSIYEAAIMGGQFFLMTGLLAAISAITRPSRSDIQLVLTGCLWSLAIGARLTLILPIGFMMIMIVYMLWKNEHPEFGELLKKAICLGLPVFIGFMLLAWYNWARFGSVSETGFTYALAGTNIQDHLDEVISYRYTAQNLYNYFFVPFRLDEQFPYLYSNYGMVESIFPFYALPGFYNTNSITGLFFVVPFIFFSLIPLCTFALKKVGPHTQYTDNENLFFRWILITLYGSVLVTLLLLLMFFWGAMRYVADFLPMLIIVSIIGYCQSYSCLQGRYSKKILTVTGICLGVLSVLISTTLGLGEAILSFQASNPSALYLFDAVLK